MPERRRDPMDAVNDSQLATLVTHVPVDPDQQRWLLERLREVRLEDEMRALVLFNVGDFVLAHRGEQAHARFVALHSALGIGSFFAPTPFRALILLLNQVAALCFPDLPPDEGLELFFFQHVSGSRNHPLIQINLRAVHDIWSFLQLQAQTHSNWQRFGEVDIERANDTTALVHFNRQYSALMMPLQTGALRGFLSLFDLNGRVSAEAHDAHNFTIEMRW